MKAATTINIEHTYTMVSYMMTVNGKNYIVKEGTNPNDGESEVREIINTDSKGQASMIVQTHTDEWLRLEKLFQQNRTE